MHNNKIRYIPALLLIGSLSSFTLAADPAMHAAILANPCAGCHGTDARGAGMIPALDKLPSSYIATAMKEFKEDKRMGSVMNRIAKGYTDAEIDLMVKHFDNARKAK